MFGSFLCNVLVQIYTLTTLVELSHQHTLLEVSLVFTPPV